MNFKEAMTQVKNGKNVRRECWKNDEYVYCSEDDYLLHSKPYDISNPHAGKLGGLWLYVTELSDTEATDWQLT